MTPDLLFALTFSQPAFAQSVAAEPTCIPEVERSAIATDGRLRAMGRPEAGKRRFVSDDELRDAYRIVNHGSGTARSSAPVPAVPGVPYRQIPGERRLADLLEFAGGQPAQDGSMRLAGGQPMVILDDVPLRSDLE